MAWEKNATNGQANFDIDDDVSKDQLEFFAPKKRKRIEAFQDLVKSKILSNQIRNNKQLYDFTLEEGHISTHSSDVLKKMKKDKLITYECSSPLVNYENAYQKQRILDYILITK